MAEQPRSRNSQPVDRLHLFSLFGKTDTVKKAPAKESKPKSKSKAGPKAKAKANKPKAKPKAKPKSKNQKSKKQGKKKWIAKT